MAAWWCWPVRLAAMNLWFAAALGVLQGLTEFLPVSSSGHLALAQMLIPGFDQPGVVFDAMLHLGTASAVVFFERRSLLAWLRTASGRRLLALLVLGTAATALSAFPLRGPATAAFDHATWVGIFLVLTGVVVAATRLQSGGAVAAEGTGWRQAVVVGFVQGMAVFPGISRSGLTIAAGLGVGLDRAWAARFSFLLSIPAVLGATVVELVWHGEQLAAAGTGFWLACLVGAATAAAAGYLALKIVIQTLRSQVFHRFGWYVLPAGLVVIAASLGVLG
jgi:undecaprenyl-diphosphatase